MRFELLDCCDGDDLYCGLPHAKVKTELQPICCSSAERAGCRYLASRFILAVDWVCVALIRFVAL